MALTLSGGVLAEDFNYGDPLAAPVPVRPAEFDYAGTALTNAGQVVCAQQTFLMCAGTTGPDAKLPYGGPPSSNAYYLRFPTLGWNTSAGMFVTVTTTATATLSFDRCFSGYVGDRFSVVLNGVERITITGSAGYGWTRSTLTLPKGTNTLAFVLKTAAYTGTGIVREGVAQSSSAVQLVNRYQRLTNLSITNVKALPAAVNQQAYLSAGSSLSATGTTKVPARLALTTSSWLLYSVHSGPVSFAGDSTVAAPNAFVGKFGAQTCTGDSSFTTGFTLGAHHASDTGGLALSSKCLLQVDRTLPTPALNLLRPMRRSALLMTRPTVINGEPTSPLADCTTEIATQCRAAQSIRRVDPHSPANSLPIPATWRWLSVDADSDPDTAQLIEWHATSYSGPVWTTPGDYRPSVANFTIKIDGKPQAVHYPSVQFDAAHLDHVVAEFPDGSVSASGDMTWVMVGAFARFRGTQADNCPILDYNADRVVNYAPNKESVADRGNFEPWTDLDTAASIYLGLTGYSDKDHTSSRLCYRTADAAKSFGRSNAVVLSDASPVILIYRLSGTTGTIAVTPLVAGHNSSTQTSFTRAVPTDPPRRSFALAKSRVTPPFGGSFLTGSMSLLEVSFYARAITNAEITAIQSFYLSLYSPVAGGIVEPDYTQGTVTVSNEQLLLYAADPETTLAFLTGNKAIDLGVYPSTVAGRTEIDRFNAQGVPVVQVSNRDYSALLQFMGGDA